MLVQLLVFVAGLAALVLGANALVRGASRLALAAGISPLVVGLTVVAMGTSAPEVAVSVGASLDGQPDIAVGNVVGSNVFNVLFILGASALIAPLIVNAQLIRQEVPVMIGVTALAVGMCLDGRIGRAEAGLLVTLLVVYTVVLIIQSRRANAGGEPLPAAAAWDRHWAVQVALVLGGLALLVVGSEWLVGAAVAIARAFGVSEVVIGLTIVAAGTSMPEVATSVTAALKGERDIAVGNVVGSNVFNILGCLGVAGLVSSSGLPVAPSIAAFDAWVMLAVALACLPVFFTGREIARWEGALFLAYYAAYTVYLILAAQHHDALPMYSAVMLGFVVPITAVTLGVIALGALRRRRV